MQVDSRTGDFLGEFTLGVFVYYNGLLEISPDRNTLYFANRFISPGTLAKYDVSTEQPNLLYKNPHGSLGSNGQDLALSHSGDRVHYAVGGGNDLYDIAAIRTSDMQILGYFETGAYPREITLSPDDEIAYAVHTRGHIDLYDTATHEAMDEYRIFGEASELIVDHSGNHLFAAVGDELRVYAAGTPENLPPLANAGPDSTTECDSPQGALVTLDGSASADPDSAPGTNDDIVLFDWYEDLGLPSETPLGEGEIIDVTLSLSSHLITLRVTDRAGATDTDDVVKTVVDTTPPEISVSIDPDELWPPNHRMIAVEALVTATDNCGSPAVELVSVTSSEPDNGEGDGDTVDDIQGEEPGTADYEFLLRAERSGLGDGRTYTAAYVTTDTSGNQTSGEGMAFVPHDQGGTTEPIDTRLSKNDRGTLLEWDAVPGASYYNVTRGNLSDLYMDAAAIRLGQVKCIKASLVENDTTGWEDPEVPTAGESFYYLVEYVERGMRSSYGTVSAPKPRVVDAGDCE